MTEARRMRGGLLAGRPSRFGLALVAAAALATACGGVARDERARSAQGGLLTRAVGASRPPLAVVAREGDALSAVAVAVTTEGIDTQRGALVAVSLAALVQERLTGRGIEATAVGGWNGWRLHATVASPAEAAAAVDAIRTALLAPIAADEPALAAVKRRAAALAQRTLADPALVDMARCTGDAFSLGAGGIPSATELEAWRRAAHGLGRIAIATSGAPEVADAAAHALALAPSWPRASPIVPAPWPLSNAGVAVYDASSEFFPVGARIVVTARTASAERAVAAASVLGNPRGPLAARLAALATPAHLRSVIGTAHVDGGCLAATVELGAPPVASEVTAGIATAAALSLQEIAVEMGDIAVPADLSRSLAVQASDPRESAERAAWWSLAGRSREISDSDLRVHLVVGVASPRQAAERAAGPREDAIRAEIDRAMLAWHSPVIDARTRVERGQGQMWILLASPCGTLSESAGDAGAGAAVALAATAQASQDAADVEVEPFVAADAIGVLVHGAARPGETPQAHAMRLADVTARALAAESLDPELVAQARIRLTLDQSSGAARMRATLGAALAPGHPSWIEPRGTPFGIASESDEAIQMRAAAVRAGPLRVAVVANVDEAQADAAVRGVDRWIARRPGELRVCPPIASLPPVHGGTFAVEQPTSSLSQVLLAIPLPADDEASRTAATWLAAALDGSDGLLAHALGAAGSDPSDPLHPPMARAWGAAVVGPPRASALVVRIDAEDDALDGAVAQVRVLLDRLRQGALREEDRTRAARSLDLARADAALDPRTRTVDLWRTATARAVPSLEALRSFSANVLRDDDLVIVAGRPSRVAAPPRAFPLHDATAK